ncbi:MAG: ABC transporter ATP-binding protein, partial [Erysipelotrichia bacterium]|nr:ABC transporter ATP-binding protein [Erysipelotrichia bacterium]
MNTEKLSTKKDDIIFQIKDLKCKYPKKKGVNEKIVFKLDNLEIQRGKVTIILGLSGSGKSTFLETIGLMTKTIQEGSQVIYFNDKQEDYDLLKIWGKSQDEQDLLRKENFSFIFQDTNLMPNFSNVNNVALADLKNSKNHNLTLKQVRKKACEKLQSFGLPKDSIDKSPKDLSGGQMQRVAFSRAVLPDFKVLFGDEPTGNLDFKHANYLMTFISDEIKGSDYQKSAIIVSHNIPLSIAHADEIMVLSR